MIHPEYRLQGDSARRNFTGKRSPPSIRTTEWRERKATLRKRTDQALELPDTRHCRTTAAGTGAGDELPEALAVPRMPAADTPAR